MLASESYVAGPWRYERVTGASHWIPLDAPDQVNRLLLEFLDEGCSATASTQPSGWWRGSA